MPKIVGVNICCQFDAVLTGLVELFEDVSRLSPIAFFGEFDVGDLYGYFGDAPDLDDFIEGIGEGDVFTADVANIAAIGGGGDMGELEYLIARRVEGAFVFQTGGQTEGSLGEVLSEEFFHGIDLGLGGAA